MVDSPGRACAAVVWIACWLETMDIRCGAPMCAGAQRDPLLDHPDADRGSEPTGFNGGAMMAAGLVSFVVVRGARFTADHD